MAISITCITNYSYTYIVYDMVILIELKHINTSPLHSAFPTYSMAGYNDNITLIAIRFY